MTRFYKKWTTHEESALAAAWVTTTPMKEFLHLFGGRSYESVVLHANKHMKLGKRPTPVRSTYSAVWDSVERILKTGVHMTAADIAKKVNCSYRQVIDLLHANQRSESPVVHVATWRRAGDGWQWIEVWAYGEGDDMRRPRAKSNEEKARLRRMRRSIASNTKSFGVFGTVVSQLNQAAA